MSRALLSLLFFLSLATAGFAHPMDEWFVTIEVSSQQGLRGSFRVPANQVESLKATPLQFELDSKPLSVRWSELGSDGDGRIKLEATAELGAFERLDLNVPEGLLDENQSLVGFITLPGQEPTTLLVKPGGSAAFINQPGVAGPDSVGGSFQLGIANTIKGYDHLLFLFCLLMAGGAVKHLLVVVTAYAVGHSVTLAASVLGLISLPSQMTETLIALSIVVAALLNIWWLRKNETPEETSSIKGRGILAAIFGLVHGFGFATVLKENGVQGSGVAVPLVGFNLGVEAGQIAIVALFVPLLIAVNRWNRRAPFLMGCSCLAGAIGAYWVVERLGIIG